MSSDQERIPIKNIFHMLCYAWNILEQSKVIDVDAWDVEKPVDLFARVLISGTRHLLRYGIGREYVSLTDEVSFLKGKVDFLESERKLLFKHGRAQCIYDELVVDFINNQILKSTLLGLAGTNELDPELKNQIKALTRKLSDVSEIRLSRAVFRRIKIHANSRLYRLLMNVCQLIFNEGLLENRTGHNLFRDFIRDERKMARVYEKFLFNFFKKSQNKYKVTRERIKWNANSEDDPTLGLLPSMFTDISLRSTDKTIIIDAKYYKKTLNSFYGTKKIRTNNLYQIHAYLTNLEGSNKADDKATGILLYCRGSVNLST